MRIVLLDTVGLLALWDAADQWHETAEAAVAVLTASGARLVTTNYVLLECGNAASRRPFRPSVIALRRQMLAQERVLLPTDEEMQSAWAAYARGEGADAGIVDHVSFIVMRRLGITDVFTNDRHFKAAGFHTLF